MAKPLPLSRPVLRLNLTGATSTHQIERRKSPKQIIPMTDALRIAGLVSPDFTVSGNRIVKS